MIRRSKAQWRALIEAQSESGLSAAEFCKREGVTYQTFCARKCDLNPDRKKSSLFVPVKTKLPEQVKSAQIVIAVDGIEIKLPAGLSAAHIGNIIKACAA